MSNRTPYEGETQHFTEYSAPSPAAATTHLDDAPPARTPPDGQPYRQTGRRDRRAAPLLGLGAIAIGVALLVNSGRLPIPGGFIERSTSVSESFSAQQLALDVGNGNITLARAGGDQIEVEAISHGYGWTPGAAERAAERIAPRISVAGDTLRIEEQRFNAITVFGRSPYVEYRIALPPDVSASVSTGSGDLAADTIDGALQLKTGSGDVRITNAGGELQLNTGSGEIEVEGVRGRLTADTGSGDISVAGAETTAIELTTGSGDVDFAGSLPSEGAYRVSTGSGDISIALPEDANVALSAGTSSGEIDIDDRWPASVDENSATAQLGNGGATLELRASSGDIRVEAE